MHKFANLTKTTKPWLSAISLGTVSLFALLSTSSLAFAEEAAAPATSETAPAVQQEASAPADAAEAKTDAEAPAPPTMEQRETAMKSFQEGQAAFEEGKFTEAAAAFQAAYEAIPSPHAEYWIAVSLDKADPEDTEPEKIARAYQTLLNNPGAGHVGADKVEEAKARFEELRKFLPVTLTIVSTPVGASVSIDGEAQEGVTPLEVELKSGKHQLEVSLEGHQPASFEVDLVGGLHLEQQVELAELPPPPPPVAPVVPMTASPEEEKKKSIVPAAVTLGLGGAGLIAGTVFGIMALNSKAKFKDDPTAEYADAAERNALIADMSFGVALTLGITGIVLLTAKGEDSATAKAKRKPRREFMVAPYASPRGAGAAAHLTF